LRPPQLESFSTVVAVDSFRKSFLAPYDLNDRDEATVLSTVVESPFEEAMAAGAKAMSIVLAAMAATNVERGFFVFITHHDSTRSLHTISNAARMPTVLRTRRA
jgi:hypothetical protein